MYDLIGNISLVSFVIGLIGWAVTIILIFVSIRKAHLQKTKITRKRFVKFIYLVGITAVISGAGWTVSIAIDSLPDFSVFWTFLTSILCMGIYPAAMIGVYIFDVKYYGYVECNRREK